MFVVDRPRFDRHPLDDRFTRLWQGDRLVINALEACDWERGEFGACEYPGDADYPVAPDDPAALAEAVRLGEAVALIPPASDHRAGYGYSLPDFTEPFGGVVLFSPAAWRAVAWRVERPRGWQVKAPRDVAIPPPTRSQLVRAWLAGAPEIVRTAPDRSGATGTRRLAAAERAGPLAVHPGTLESALAACRRVEDWAAADPQAPAPGTLEPPGAPAVTLYFDGPNDAVAEWSAFAAPLDGPPGLGWGEWTLRPDGEGWGPPLS
ncbi:hypothetical protein [Alienimonas sp. DA493]|uniref:hypothetical protein n=1 Tax=Alienimonas sp. DA493 TaxID=3373605 RepID=UPI003754D08A